MYMLYYMLYIVYIVYTIVRYIYIYTHLYNSCMFLPHGVIPFDFPDNACIFPKDLERKTPE